MERAITSRGEAESYGPELARAHEWLLGAERTLMRLDRHRRFAVPLRGRTLAGELERVWIASGAGTPTRVLIGVRDPARAEIESRVAARALGLEGSEMAALVLEPGLTLFIECRS
jgi:hypothetical protein